MPVPGHPHHKSIPHTDLIGSPSSDPSAPGAMGDAVRAAIDDIPSRDRDHRSAIGLQRTAAQLFDEMFEQAAIGMAHTSIDGRWLRVNRRLCDLTGYSREELLAGTWQSITHPDDLEEDAGYVAALHAGELPHYTMDKRYVRKDGSIVWVNILISLVREADGSPSYHVCVVDDISARKRDEAERAEQLAHERMANRELRALQAITDTALANLAPADLLHELVGRIRDVFEVDNVAILLHDEGNRDLQVAAARGIHEEVAVGARIPIGAGFAGRIAASRAPLAVDDLATFEAGSAPPGGEHMRSAAGVPLLVEQRLLGVLYVGTAAPRHFCEEDIRLLERVATRAAQAIERSDLYQAERQARAELGAVFDAMTEGIFVYDAEGRVARSNAAARSILGMVVPDQDPEGQLPAHERVPYMRLRDEAGNALPEECWPITRLLRGETIHSEDAQIVRMTAVADGDLAFAISGAPLRNTDGPVVGAVAILRDVTERERLKREADDRAAELTAVVETMPDAAALFGADGQVLLVNAAFRALFRLDERPGFFAQPVEVRRRLLEIRDPNGNPLLPEHSPFERVLRGGETLSRGQAVDIQTRTADGRTTDVEVVGSPVRGMDGRITGAVLLYRDVTERRRLERRTRQVLDALLQMAEALVAAPEAVPSQEAEQSEHGATPIASPIARRLAELAREILGVARLGMHALDPDTQAPRPLAVTGLSPEQEREWFAASDSDLPLRDTPVLGVVVDCAPGEVRIIDMTQPPYSAIPDQFSIREVALAPMYLGDHIVGVLAMDHGGAPHNYTADELDLAYAVAGLAAVVIERERLLREREQARAEALALAEANRRMDEFLGIASHELRTPLTSVKANLQFIERQLNQMLQVGKIGPVAERLASLDGLVHRAVGAAARQQRLVEDLLDVSRIRAGKVELRLKRADLAEIVHPAVEEQRLAHPERTLMLDLPADTLWVEADPDRVSQVVTNYLTNALKYSDAAQPVAVRVGCVEGEARVEVADHGLGLDPAELDRIWDLFYRSPGVDHRNRWVVGLGLGLHISREIVERHGGRVGVESIPGAGSTFWFALPLSTER